MRQLHLKPDPNLENKDLRIHFEPTPDEIQRHEKQAQTEEDEKKEPNVIQCENLLCNQSVNDCENVNVVDDQLLMEFIEEGLDVITNNENESKEVNTDSTNMRDNSSETRNVNYANEKGVEKLKKRRRRRRCNKSSDELQSSDSENSDNGADNNKFKCCM